MDRVPFLIALFIATFVHFVSIFTKPLNHTNVSQLESPLLFQLPYSSRRLFVSFRACHLVRSHRQHTVRLIAHNGFEFFYKEQVNSGNPHLTWLQSLWSSILTQFFLSILVGPFSQPKQCQQFNRLSKTFLAILNTGDLCIS